MQPIGPVLKCRRKALGLSQDKMAQRLYVNSSAISLWESGNRHIAPEDYEKVCRAYELDYSTFIRYVFELPDAEASASGDSEPLLMSA